MDEKILRLLNEDPEAGMSLLMEQYMGLLWSACRLYLNNPEDIRECVQETFLDFYEHRARFQEEKGTIKAYLYVIAKRKAIGAAARNGADAWLPLDENMRDDQETEEALLDREMLEQALKKLKEQDSRIIRMKYYEGMTCQEIAHAMNLPLETVKKRQQRSLKKLRRILVALAVLAVLTACAAAVAYRVRFSPSTGIQDMEGSSWYEMVGGPTVVETNQGKVTVQNLFWKEGTLYIRLEFEAGKFDNETTDLSTEIRLGTGISGQSVGSMNYSSRGSDGMLESAEFRRERIEETVVQQPITLYIFDEVCTVEMKPIDSYEDFQDIGLTQTHKGRTIVLQTDRTEEQLSVDAYVYSENVWKIRGLYDFEDYYKTAERPGWQSQKLVDDYSYHYETTVPEGEPYTLNIDTLFLVSEGETVDVEIPIPKDSADVDIPFTYGGDTYRVSRIEWSRGTGEYGIGNGDEDMETAYGDELFITVEPVDLEENTRLYGIGASLGTMEIQYGYVYDRETRKLNPEPIQEKEQFRRITDNMFLQYEDRIRFLITDPEELDQETLFLRMEKIYKFWDQTYTFQIRP